MDDLIRSDYGARSVSGPPSTSCVSAEAKVECVFYGIYAEYLYRNTLSTDWEKGMLLKVVSSQL